jgi:predicted regulator of Ras-like GTPase activity (Roadblock/LC7/MglB family)
MSISIPTQRQCRDALDALLHRCDGVVAAMFALRDGRPYVERSRAMVSESKFAAMTSSLMALSSSVMREIAVDTLNYLLIEGERHKLVLCKLPGSNGALVFSVLARSDISLGLLLGLAKTCVKDVYENLPDAVDSAGA